jgi:hypothetical protein
MLRHFSFQYGRGAFVYYGGTDKHYTTKQEAQAGMGGNYTVLYPIPESEKEFDE